MEIDSWGFSCRKQICKIYTVQYEPSDNINIQIHGGLKDTSSLSTISRFRMFFPQKWKVYGLLNTRKNVTLRVVCTEKTENPRVHRCFHLHFPAYIRVTLFSAFYVFILPLFISFLHVPARLCMAPLVRSPLRAVQKEIFRRRPCRPSGDIWSHSVRKVANDWTARKVR